MIVSSLFSNILFLTIVIAIVAASTQLSANAMIFEMADTGSDIDIASSTSDTTTYIITFKDNGESPAKRCAAIARSSRGTVKYVYDQVNGCALTVSVEDVQGALNGLKNNPTVLAAEQDQMVSIADSNEGNMFDATSDIVEVSAMVPSWGLDRINQCSLPLDNLATKQSANGVTVFIIDTGVYSGHNEFAGMIGPNDCHFSAFSTKRGDALKDGNGHG